MRHVRYLYYNHANNNNIYCELYYIISVTYSLPNPPVHPPETGQPRVSGIRAYNFDTRISCARYRCTPTHPPTNQRVWRTYKTRIIYYIAAAYCTRKHDTARHRRHEDLFALFIILLRPRRRHTPASVRSEFPVFLKFF